LHEPIWVLNSDGSFVVEDLETERLKNL